MDHVFLIMFPLLKRCNRDVKKIIAKEVQCCIIILRFKLNDKLLLSKKGYERSSVRDTNI